jgi:AcrR family transcriptional regulator
LKPTSQHILDHALKLFNQYGTDKVRLQHIADAAFVSVGHLAYYFKNKEAIVAALYNRLTKELEILLSEFRVVPLFEDVNRQLKKMFQLQQSFPFFYLDTLEVMRAYTSIKEKHQQHIQWQISQILVMLEFNIARGAFQQTALANLQQLAWLFWMSADRWMYARNLEGLPANEETEFLNLLWSILKPYFSNMGEREYEQLFLFE